MLGTTTITLDLFQLVLELKVYMKYLNYVKLTFFFFVVIGQMHYKYKRIL